MRADLTEKRVSNPKTDADAKKGTLYGDDTLTDLMSQMRFTISTTMQAGNPAAYDELVEMGISTGASTGGATFSQDAVNGKLVLDTAKLTDALTKDPTSVQRLLGGITGTNGFAQSFSSTLDPYTQTGGLLDGRIDSAGTEITDLTDSIARMDDRLSQKEQSLRTMFTNLEVALQKAKSQGQELLSHLGISNDG